MAFQQYHIDHSELPHQKAILLKNQKEQGYSFSLLLQKVFSFSIPPFKRPQSCNDPTFRANKKQNQDDSKISLLSPAKYANGTQPFLNLSESPNKNSQTAEINLISDGKDFTIEENILNRNDKFSQFATENLQFEKTKNILERNQILGLDDEISDNSTGHSIEKMIRQNTYELTQNTFLMQISQNPLYLKLLYALELFSNSQMENARTILVSIEQECAKQIEQKKSNLKEYMIILVQSMCYQAQIERCMGEQSNAIKQLNFFILIFWRILEKCLTEFRISEPEILGKIYLEIGQNYFQKLQLNRAFDYFNKALILYERLNWQHEIPGVLKNIAFIYAIYGQYSSNLLLGSYNNAKTIAYCALEQAQQQIPPDFYLISDIYYTIAFTYYINKEYEFALQYIDLCNELIIKNILYVFIGQNSFGENKQSLGKSYNLIGVIYQVQGISSKAIENYDKALKIYGNQCLIAVAQIYNNLGLALTDYGDFEAAEEAFNKGLSIYQEFYSTSHPLMKRLEKNKFQIKNISI